MTSAIHQPDFFPWLGFFHKISGVKTYIVFDHVEISMGKSWTSRNQIILNGNPVWLTIPIMKSGNAHQSIRETKINYQMNFVKKHLGTLKQAYGKSLFFEEVFHEITLIYAKNHTFLMDFNLDYIHMVINKFSWDLEILHSFDLFKNNLVSMNLKGNDTVLELCKNTKTNKYISGTGCLDFILPETFQRENIEFIFQQFKHPIYTQKNHKDDFIPNMSSLDALFNLGFDDCKKLIENSHG